MKRFDERLKLPGDVRKASGEYAYASEIVREGVRLLMRQEAEKLEWLRNAIAVGLADVAAGGTIEAKRSRRAREPVLIPLSGWNAFALPVLPYLVFYIVKAKGIYVIRVLYGHREVKPLLASLLLAV